MKKRILSLILSTMMILTSSAFAAEFKKLEDRHAVPASERHQPFLSSPFTTQYAPWYKVWHQMSQSEYERGENGGEGSQQMRAIDFSPVNPDIMYFGTDTSGIYASKNGGETWYNTNNGFLGANIYDIRCDPHDEDTVYVMGKNYGVARSTDGGKSWVEILPISDDTKGMKGRVLKTDSAGNLYAVVANGIFKLDKKTQTVTNLTPEYEKLDEATGLNFTQLDITEDGMHIYASIANNATNLETAKAGIYSSHDGGKTWSIKGYSDTMRFSSLGVAMHPENPMEIYASGSFLDNAENKTVEGREIGLFVSYDGGDSWERIYQHVYENLAEGVAANAKSFYQLEFGPKNAAGVYDLYYVASESTYNLRVSHDYGKTFEMVHTPEHRLMEDTWSYEKDAPKVFTSYYYQPYVLDMTRPGHLFFGGMGPWEYDNGKVTRKAVGFSGGSVLDIAINKKGEAFLCITDRRGAYTQTGVMTDPDNFPTTIVGQYSASFKQGNSFVNAVFDPNDDNHVIAYVGIANSSPAFHGMRHSWDRGQSFEPMAEDAKVPSVTQGNSQFIKYDPEDSNTIYTTYLTSHDNGKTWQANEYAVVAMSNDCTRWLGTKGTSKSTEYYYSTDKGKTWEFILKPAIGSMEDVILDEGGDYAWITRAYGLYRIDIENKKIVTYNSKVGCGSFRRIAQNPENPNHIIVTGMKDPKMLFLSETRDGGETWNPIPSGAFVGTTHLMKFLNGQFYFSGMSGTHIYDYKKYWEFLDSKITVMLDDKEIGFTVMPEIVNGRTMVPMRELFEMLGATVNWDGETRTVNANKGRDSVKLQIDNLTVNMNGEEKQMEAAPYIKDSRTMVPLRFASEALGIRVGWDDETNTIIMRS